MTEIKDPTQSPQDRMMAEVVQGAGDGKSMDFSANQDTDPKESRSLTSSLRGFHFMIARKLFPTSSGKGTF